MNGGLSLIKLAKKIQNWASSLLSIVGRVTLINSILSAISLLCFLCIGHQKRLSKIDQIRCQFLWQGTHQQRKKYSLLNWTTVCMKKEHGSMGILNLEIMNISLLLKWW